MRIAIIITTPDFAGMNIKECLLKDIDFEETREKYDGYPVLKHGDVMLYTTDKQCVHMERIDEDIDSDMFIVPTTHRSEAGTNSLSCHTQGNWDKADLGGIPRNLSLAPAFYLKKAYSDSRSCL